MGITSLRSRLFKWLAFPLAGGILLIGVASYFSAYHEADEVYDAQLVHMAKVLHLLVKHEMEEEDEDARLIEIADPSLSHTYEKSFAYRLWANDKLVLHSSNAVGFGEMTKADGFTDRTINQDSWRFFVYHDGTDTVEVAEKYKVREDMIEHIMGGIFIPEIFILPMLGIILSIGIVKGIEPLGRLSKLIVQRNPSNLQPLEATSTPKEMMPVVDSFNQLMRRIKDVMEMEKQFSNYASHELRTPLAALKTQVQVALRTPDIAKQKTMFNEVVNNVDRMSHLVEQLLTYSRVQNNSKNFSNHFKPLDLSVICQKIVEKYFDAAARKNIEITANIAPDIFAKGDEEMIFILIGNLVDNAIKYSFAGGNVNISLANFNGDIILRVIDDGIGIKEEEIEKVFHTFYRIPNNLEGGSGLGLAIVKWIADMHGITISVQKGSENKGSAFVLRFKN